MMLITSAAHANVPLRGVQLHSLWSDSTNAEMDRELDLTELAGANMVRVDVVWGSLETEGKGRMTASYVTRLDRFVNGAAARGIKVIATFTGTPCWASSAPVALKLACAGPWWDRGVGNYPPSNPSDYADAAAWVVARYGTKLAALEVWNEPNLGSSFETPDRAGEYAALVRAAYPSVKAANAAVPMLAGSMSYSDRPFLDALYANGIAGHQDGISVHPYNEWRDPADLWQPEWRKYAFLPGLAWVRDGQVAAGESANDLWITEFGWTTATGQRWGVSERQQADYVARGFDLLEDVPYIEAAAVYNLREKGNDPADFEHNFGLVNRDFTPKPAYAALSAALHRRGGGATPAPKTPGGGGSTGSAPAKSKGTPLELPSVPGDPVPVTLQTQDRQLVAVARVAPSRSVLIDAVSCSSRKRVRLRATASKRGAVRKRVGVGAKKSQCRVNARVAKRPRR